MVKVDQVDMRKMWRERKSFGENEGTTMKLMPELMFRNK